MPKDPSMEQTAAGLSTTQGISGDCIPDSFEREILRDLAKQIADLSARPIEQEKRRLWTAHNDLQHTRPLIFCDPENGWNEIVLQSDLKCIKPLLRVWEMNLRKEIFWGTKMLDDKVIEPYFNVPYNYSDSGWGLVSQKIGGEDGGSYTWLAPIKDYETDFSRLKFPEINIDYAETEKVLGIAKELFDDILTVRLRGVWWWTLGMTWDYITLRGLENFMLDLYDNPEWVHRTMAFLRDGTLHKLDFLEANGLLALNTEGTYVGSGGFGWTTQLPNPGFDSTKVRTRDMWGFAESQETVGVSTEMFKEFIFPYQKPILERFGLNCYGCCEPMDPRWEVVKGFPRLRRVSCSPWANYQKMAEYLGDKYILSLKPSPTPLAQAVLDEDYTRETMRNNFRITKNCIVEAIMKDNHTLGKNPLNANTWCRRAREEAERL
jgi:hypothetical protein